MHTLLIHQGFTTPNEAGGTRHFELGRGLVERGHHFTVIGSDISYITGRQSADEFKISSDEKIDGMRVLRCYTYPSLHGRFFGRLFSFVSFAFTSFFLALFRAGKVDVVMGTSPPIFQSVSASILAFVRRRPFVLEIRDLWPEFIIDMGLLTNSTMIRFSRWLERFLYKRASHLLVNSPAYVDYLIEKGVPASKITLLPNGVEPEMFDPASDGGDLRERLNLTGKFVVVYAGAIGPANNLGLLLDAAAELRDDPQICFVLVGDGKERAGLQAKAAELELKNVLFAGPHSKHDIPSFLACADACVAVLQNIRMFRMTYPNKVFDYMAAGRPVLLAIDGVIREVVETAQAGLFIPPNDAKAFADGVRHLEKHRQEGREMGRRGRLFVERDFNRAQHRRQFAEFLETVANAHVTK
jgi:glycosyltransferase involved in cell wall biosynthesis